MDNNLPTDILPEDVAPSDTPDSEVSVNDSILLSIKKLLGIDKDYEQFDTDIIIFINSVFSTLNQLGVGPEETYSIQGKDNVWDEFIGENKDIQLVKSYVYKKVRLIFDPPQSSFVLEALNKMIAEDEFRMNVMCDTQKKVEEEIEDDTTE